MKKIVIGLGFGDEGKGLVVDWLASKNPDSVVVRYSGGHQVGHCVRIGNDKHIFSNFGSGTLRGLPTIWNAKTCDPVAFCKEYNDIFEYNPKISINHKCAITTPYEKISNIESEKVNNHGSMGCGFGATIQRREDNYHIYFKDIYYSDIFLAKMESIKQYYLKKGIICDDYLLKDFFDSCEKIKSKVTNQLFSYTGEIYESSQGLMLDMDYGIFPNVTRSRVGTQEIELKDEDEFYLVTRAYQTRHGNGWCSGYYFKPNTESETNVFNDHQGEFKTRILNLDLLQYAISIDDGIRESQNKNLVITCLDQMKKYPLESAGHIEWHSSEDKFIRAILSELPQMKSVYVSHGPYAKSIEQYE